MCVIQHNLVSKSDVAIPKSYRSPNMTCGLLCRCEYLKHLKMKKNSHVLSKKQNHVPKYDGANLNGYHKGT